MAVRAPRAAAIGLAVALALSLAAAGNPGAAGGEVGPPELVAAIEVSDVPIGHLALLYDEVLDPTSIPDRTDFMVELDDATQLTPDSVEHVYSGFSGSGGFGQTGLGLLVLHLPVLLDPGDTVLVTYTPHPDRPIRDLALNEAAALPGVEGGIATPESIFGSTTTSFVGSVIDGPRGADVILAIFDRALDPGTLPADGADFIVLVNGTPLAVDTVSIVRPEAGLGLLDLQLAGEVAPDDEVTLEYAPQGAPISGLHTGGDLAPFGPAFVTVILPANDASATVAPGGSVSTAQADPSVGDPLGTTVTSPTGGLVTITEQPLEEGETAGYSFFGQQVLVSAPDAASATNPLVLTFTLDRSIIPAGHDQNTIEVLRNGVPVGPCTGSPGHAVPSPCVSARTALNDDGDIAITVRTVQASTWNLAIVTPYDFGGFQSPVDGNVPNVARAGSAIPVRFSVGGDHGLDIFASGHPGSQGVSCANFDDGDVIEQTVPAGESSLSYDAETDTYTYVWKTDGAWDATCRRLVLEFMDGTIATALFDFRR
jgi:uncharacterized repeat protein (TIGR02059 family)